MRILVCFGLILTFVLGGSAAQAGPAKPKGKPAALAKGNVALAKGKTVTAAAKGAKKKTARKCAKMKNGKTRRCGGGGEWGTFFGQGVASGDLRDEPLGRPSGRIFISAPAVDKAAEVQLFTPEGGYDPVALAQLDEVFQCRRTGAVRQIDPRLYEILSHVQDHFGGKAIEILSGYRFQRNENSRHYHGSAADVRIAGVADRELLAFVKTLDTGGMGIGIYPKSGFIHIDFRAPGRASYRWTDYSTGEQSSPGKRPPKGWARPNS